MSDPADLTPPEQGNPNRARRGPNRALTITLLVSVGLHLAAFMAAVLLLPRGTPVADGPEKPAFVELVMEERKGEPAPAASPQTAADTPRTEESQEKPADPKTPAPPDEKPVAGLPVTPDVTAEPATEALPAPSRTEAEKPAPEAPPPAPDAVKITLQGTDSPSNAKAWGDRVIPAAPDAVFHNRPPVYPDESVINGEHGTVVLLIHVAPSGRPASVEVMRSSGYVLLDSAAREAVERWRFLPAVKDGQPVASDMTMGFVFAYQ